MKTKRSIYFICILLGASIMGFGDYFIEKELALSVGVVFLFFGIYKSSGAWSTMDGTAAEEPKEEP